MTIASAFFDPDQEGGCCEFESAQAPVARMWRKLTMSVQSITPEHPFVKPVIASGFHVAFVIAWFFGP
jgi:hypothetical protein